MDDKEIWKEDKITYYFLGKHVERTSDSSSPETEKPPTKSVKITDPNMADLAEPWSGKS